MFELQRKKKLNNLKKKTLKLQSSSKSQTVLSRLKICSNYQLVSDDFMLCISMKATSSTNKLQGCNRLSGNESFKECVGIILCFMPPLVSENLKNANFASL